jgi:hypothetical protein
MMNRYKFFIALFLGTCFSTLYSQSFENRFQYYSYKNMFYKDDMLWKLIPEQIHTFYYYADAHDAGYAKNSWMGFDTVCQVRNIHFYSKKAKSGYLHINQSVMDFIEHKQPCLTNDIAITYLVNGNSLNNRKEVMFLIKLTKRKIKKLEYNYSETNKLLIVDIILI